MSAYEYYEFLAVDRPLSQAQQDEVRAVSSRARITSTSFTNDYHRGDFGGDPREMMERYYDAHLHITSWGTHQLMLRLPETLLDLGTARRYHIDEQVEAWVSGEHIILDLCGEDEEEDDWDEDADDSLAAMAGLRAELAAGDLRPLYLAWLAAVGTWDRDEDAFEDDFEDELEPPVPAGLGSLTAPQRALADFLRLDADLLATAASAAPRPAPVRDDPEELARWIADLTEAEKNALLVRVVGGEAGLLRLELLRRFHGEPKIDGDGAPRRTVAELLDATAELRQERERDTAPSPVR
jgi:hypothetical protein